jgi:predicted component of type VI protein secretion system
LDEQDLKLIKRLTDRLEHLSADSTYSHRASGLRGSLLRYIERLENDERISIDEQARLDELVGYGFEILVLAAKEIGKSR